MTTMIFDHLGEAYEAGLLMLGGAFTTRRYRCLGEYDAEKMCLWHGKEHEAERLNGTPICPLCGGSLREVRG